MCAEYHKQYLDWISYCMEECGLVLSNWKQIFDKRFPTNQLWNSSFFFHVILVSKTQQVLVKEKTNEEVQFQPYLNYPQNKFESTITNSVAVLLYNYTLLNQENYSFPVWIRVCMLY